MNEAQTLTDRAALNQKIYTDREAAEYLRISQVTLWRERKKGKISFRRAASKIIYTESDLESYLKSTEREAFACAA
jgi:predicted site-specific integrase-resolvase